jgi:hypothetical protein
MGDLVVQEELQHQTGAYNGSNFAETTASSGMRTLGTHTKVSQVSALVHLL